MDISDSLIFRLLQSEDEFPVDFDDAWKWIGYSKKEKALNKLLNNFEEGIDYYIPENNFSPNGGKMGKGRQLDKYYLTIDCFKSLAMMAGTSKGKEVRRYFLDCEKRLKQLLSGDTDKLIKERIVNAIVSKDAVTLYPKFEDWFYDMLYRKYGKGWENKSTSDRPSCVGRWTNNVVYDRMFGGEKEWGVKAKLLASEPKVNGRRKNPLHTHFDKDFGMDYLRKHFAQLQVVDRLTPDGDWDQFLYFLEVAIPTEGKNLQMNLLYELELSQRQKIS